MGDVVQFPKRPAVFSQGMKDRMAPKIADLTEKPSEVIDRVEDAVCAELVSVTREFAAAAAERIGNRLASLVFGEKPRRD